MKRSGRSITREGAGGKVRLTRRAAIAGLAALAGGAPGVVQAQSPEWMNNIPGFGGSRGNERRSDPRAKEHLSPQNDLRPDAMPWRSDAMMKAIEDAIARYAQIEQKGGWPAIPGTRLIRPGDDDERVPAVRRRLAASGDLRGNAGNSFTFDSELEAAVRRFQERHGLRVSGRADAPPLPAGSQALAP